MMNNNENIPKKGKQYLPEFKRKGARITTEIMQLLRIYPEHANKFYISDQDPENGLVQVHYADDIQEFWEKHNEAASNKEEWNKLPIYLPRGFVIDMKKRRVVCRSFEYTPEIIKKPETFKEYLKSFETPDIPWKFYEMKEGTIIRAFTHNGKLYLSTHRRLSCENSKWGSQLTFLEMLHEAATAIGFNIEKLKTPSREIAKCHVLLLVHQQNQCINQNLVEPIIYHLASWQITARPKDGSLASMAYIESDLGLPRPKKLDIDEAYECLIKGNAVITADEENCFKIIPESLHEKIQIRGFDYNIKHRWFELCDENKQHLLKDVVPLHLKKQIDYFQHEKEISLTDLTVFLSGIFNQELHGDWTHGIFHSREHRILIDIIWSRLNNDRNAFYTSGGLGKFYWGPSPKETQAKIFDEFYNILKNLPGAVLYTAITKYRKHQKLEQKKRDTIKISDIPPKIVTINKHKSQTSIVYREVKTLPINSFNSKKEKIFRHKEIYIPKQ